MDKNKVIIILMPILLVIMVILGYFNVFNTNTDSIRFKLEYEALNGKNDYYKVNINSNNNVKYSNYKEIFDVIKNKTGIIYLGYKESNDCRFAIDTLLKTIKENNINTNIYYLDNHMDRDSYIIEDDKLVYEKDNKGNEIKGTDNYFKLLELLDKNLSDYVLYLDDKKYEVGEKRLHFPAIIFVKKGNVLGIVYATQDMDYNDLELIYEDYLSDMYSTTCDTNKDINTPC